MTTSDAYTHGPGTTGSGMGSSTGTGATGDKSPGDGAQGVIDQVKAAGAGAADQTANIASTVADKAKEQTGAQLDNQRKQLAGTFTDTATALRQTGQHLRESDQANVAQLAEAAAERIEGFGRYLNERRLDDLVSDVEGLARREPGLFLTAAFGAGLLAARFLKSGRSTGRGDRGYTQPSGGSGTRKYGGTTGYAAERQANRPHGDGTGYSSHQASSPGTSVNRTPSAPGQYAGAAAGSGGGTGSMPVRHPNGHGGQSDWNQG